MVSLKDAQLECNSFRQVLLLLAELTPRPHLLYVLVSWLTYGVMYQSNSNAALTKNLGLETSNHQHLIFDFWVRVFEVKIYLIYSHGQGKSYKKISA